MLQSDADNMVTGRKYWLYLSLKRKGVSESLGLRSSVAWRTKQILTRHSAITQGSYSFFPANTADLYITTRTQMYWKKNSHSVFLLFPSNKIHLLGTQNCICFQWIYLELSFFFLPYNSKIIFFFLVLSMQTISWTFIQDIFPKKMYALLHFFSNKSIFTGK